MRENRTFGGVGGCRGAIPGTQPDPYSREILLVRREPRGYE